MLNLLLPILVPSLVNALPAPAPAPEPTLFTFTYDNQLVTATWEGTSVSTNAACPTQTFTYENAVITVPYTGPGTPQSCLTSAAAPAATAAPVSTDSAAAAPVAAAPVTTSAAQQPAVVPGGMGAGTTSVSAAASDSVAVTPTTTASSAATASGSIAKGFNYGSTGANGAALVESDFLTSFNTAKNLVGTSGFTSARLYTMIQAGTTNTPISAIPAAISSGTGLLLGLWASAGQANIDNEIAALQSAISQYGSAFTNLIEGISVGSEDLYRNSPTGILNMSGVGANPDDIVSFINQVKAAITGTAAAGKLVGHVDTYTAYINGSNSAVIAAADFLGMDAYPYFQNTEPNSIGDGPALFTSAYDQTVAVSQGKPVWITETGWPVSGPTENLAVPSTANALSYWDAVGCNFGFGKIPTYWYTLNDNGASPSFGVTTGSETPLYDLSCSA